MKGLKLVRVAIAVCWSLGVLSPAWAQTNVLSIYHAAELEYEMTNGALYQLQATDNLLGSWSNSGPAIVGEDCSESFLESTRDTSHKFWRVVEGSVSNVLDFSQARSLSSTNSIVFENVLWQGSNWMVRYRVGSVFHQAEVMPMRTFIIPTANITVDGSPVDWTNVPTVYTDPEHDQSPPDGSPGTDIREVRIARDSQNIYAAFFLYDNDPSTNGTMYITEFQQYYNQYHTAGDTIVTASAPGGNWEVNVKHRENVVAPASEYGADAVRVGTKFIEYKIPVADIEYDGGGLFRKSGIETRFLRTYVHDTDSNTYDGAGEDDRVMIVKFY